MLRTFVLLEDFRLTACVSIVRLASETASPKLISEFEDNTESNDPTNKSTDLNDNQQLYSETKQEDGEEEESRRMLTDLMNIPGNERPRSKSKSKTWKIKPFLFDFLSILKNLTEYRIVALKKLWSQKIFKWNSNVQQNLEYSQTVFLR